MPLITLCTPQALYKYEPISSQSFFYGAGTIIDPIVQTEKLSHGC